MIRLVLFAFLAVASAYLLVRLFGELRGARVDWTGIAAIIGFVVLAFYLRHATGMG